MPIVSIQDSECYYLRTLLTWFPGDTTFQELRTINGNICSSFKAACQELGLLNDDKIWHDTLYEATQTKMPVHMRQLFAIICAFGEPVNIPDLWQIHKLAICEDLFTKYSTDTAPMYTLSEINEILKCYGMTLQQFHLPVTKFIPPYTPTCVDILHKQKVASDYTQQLNDDQRTVVQVVLQAIYNPPIHFKKCFFLDSPAGTGKTFVYKTLIHSVRGRGDVAIPVASTGIAATLLPAGRTAHSVFKIPFQITPTSTCNEQPNTNNANNILEAKIIIWDEAPMTHCYAFQAVDRLLRDLTQQNAPFSNKTILLGGDFRQILPVIFRGSQALTITSCINKHRLWNEMKVLKLTKNMRALESETQFVQWLLQVGQGKTGDTAELPSQCLPQQQDPVAQLYGDINFSTVTAQELAARAILSITNDDSLHINNKVLNLIKCEKVTFKSH
ncbi:ATP-dependent DNA helicase pif1-like [Erpetoichthys calabaricus]|uniref:ATP-dependent DNA helicase pif1-like n=1 Tax=Erpetoichthys calabaricus TaxID=27687 RepID=UPI0022343149|nr:ATP-dependent DNA helicase pif1-like [Erpetoichthys calabaricus]